MQRRNIENDPEAGIALVTVLALLATLGLLVASVMALSQYLTAEVDSRTGLSRSCYRAESALNRAALLLARDRRRFNDRQLGRPGREETERWMADGVIHALEVAGEPVRVRIFDAVRGFDISGTQPTRQLPNAGPEGSALEQWQQWRDRLADYVDGDDLIRADGMERQGYRALDMPLLPRNRPLQFREEARFIPGLAEPDREAVASGRPDWFRVIAPDKLRPPAGRSGLYGTPLAVLRELCRLNDEETETLNEALGLWYRERRPLSETLPPGILGRLDMFSARRESGWYTIVVDTAGEAGPGVRLSATRRLDGNRPAVEYYEYLFY